MLAFRGTARLCTLPNSCIIQFPLAAHKESISRHLTNTSAGFPISLAGGLFHCGFVSTFLMTITSTPLHLHIGHLWIISEETAIQILYPSLNWVLLILSSTGSLYILESSPSCKHVIKRDRQHASLQKMCALPNLLPYFQQLRQYLAYSRCSTNICRKERNEDWKIPKKKGNIKKHRKQGRRN